MIENGDLLTRLSSIFEEKLNLNVPSNQTDLLETGLLDSLSLVELLMQLEQDFGIQISLDDLELNHFRSISGIAELVMQYQSAGDRINSTTAMYGEMAG